LKAEMEREAQQTAAQEQQQKASLEPKNYRRRRWQKNEQGEVVPKDKTRRNLTDPESRLMMDTTTNSYEQAYSAQIAVDAQAQIIVGTRVTAAPNDQEQLIPTVLEVKKNLQQLPATVSADAGYFSSAVITAEVLREIDLYVPPNEPEPRAVPEATGVRAQMWQKLLSAPGRELYNRRATIVEPVFAYIKHLRKFRQFLLRGLAAVEGEWLLICLTHNLMKLFRATRLSPMT
jgi:hypothetical protein